MIHRHRRTVLWGVCCGLASAMAAHAQIQTAPFVPASVSPDITLILGGVVVSDEDVAVEPQLDNVSLPDLGALPPGADLTAYDRLADGEQLMAFDTTLTLGGQTVRAGDVVGFDGNGYVIELDASAAGIPAGVRVDALAHTGTELLLSFDTTVQVDGLTIDDADLVRWTPSGFTLYFASAEAGVPVAMDLDAAALDASGALYLSFDIGGTLGGVAFRDEDVLRFDPGTATWTLAYDGDAVHAAWGAADLNALALTDSDGDGFADSTDNCTLVANVDQIDTDADGYGNACDGDFNNNAIVDFADYGYFRSVFGTDDPLADFNGNGIVDFADYGRFRTMFGQPPGPAAP